jgi:hypothetical protein
MKISFNKKLATSTTPSIVEGRHVGTIIQIAALGDQPGFNAGELPVPSVGVVVQLNGSQIAKKMRISDSPMSALFAYLDAALPDPEGYDGDNPLPLTLGRPIAVEVTVRGQYANVASFHRLESFEVGTEPKVGKPDLVFLEDPDSLVGDDAKALFLKLHRDVRSWVSKRVRG